MTTGVDGLLSRQLKPVPNRSFCWANSVGFPVHCITADKTLLNQVRLIYAQVPKLLTNYAPYLLVLHGTISVSGLSFKVL